MISIYVHTIAACSLANLTYRASQLGEASTLYYCFFFSNNYSIVSSVFIPVIYICQSAIFTMES